MTILKRPLFYILFCATTMTLHAQYKAFPDSIRVEFADQKSIVLFELRDYRTDADLINNFPSMLASLLDPIRNSIPANETSQSHKVDIVFSQQGKHEGLIGHQRFIADQSSDKYDIVIYKTDVQKTLLSVKGNTVTELLPPGWEIRIKGRNFLIDVYAPDFAALEAIAKQNLQPVIASLGEELRKTHIGRRGMLARLVMQKEQIVFKKIDHRNVHDMLGIHAGAGVGLFKDTFYPELDFSLALYFADRHRVLRNRLELSYEIKFFPGRNEAGDYRMLTNSFVNFFYGRNFSKDRPRWTSIGVGYLVNSNGDIYKGKTMKFFLDTDIGSSKINLIPEFYLTNDFKDFAFGLKLQYKF